MIARRHFLPTASLSAALLATLPAAAKNPAALELSTNVQHTPVGAIIATGSGVVIAGDRGGTTAVLARSDGTVGGTTSFAQLPPTGNTLGFAEFLGASGGKALTQDGTSRVWTTDGTLAGTSLVGPGFDRGWRVAVLPNGVVVYAVFGDNTPAPPYELIRIDGTSIAKIQGATLKTATQAISVGNDLYFITPFGAVKRTDASTVVDVHPGSITTDSIALCGGVLYLGSNDSLARVDGATKTTLATVPAHELFCAGTRVVFRGYTAAAGNEPWVSDGTVGGTKMLLDIAPGAAASITASNADRASRRVVGSRLFFTATDSAGLEPWVTDGTTAGTKRVGDLAPGADSSYPAVLGVVGTSIYFLATHSLYALADGSTTATLVTSNLIHEPTALMPLPAVAGGKIFAQAGNGRYLWVFDPSAPVDAGDGMPDVIPYVAPSMASEGTGSSSSGSSTSSSSGGGSDASSSSSSGGSSGTSSSTSSSSSSSSSGGDEPSAALAAPASDGCAVAPSRASSVGALLLSLIAFVAAARRSKRA